MVRFYFVKQVEYNLNICFADGVLTNRACFVEGHIQESGIFWAESYDFNPRNGFRIPNKRLDFLHYFKVYFTRVFYFQ